ncbi:hypothetical protein [uncultured Sphingomonas sp.]|uniref:hypothetical protein n=1 Tax=uncultured Sphingomonas sp. TaxID=158754 RepID=UPI0025E6DF50|nr:hypothetical protein [uncultured Sphingomonas sp.]
MLKWLRRFSSGSSKSTVETKESKPLSFSYRDANGEKSSVRLLSWVEDGVYVHGENIQLGRRMTYRLDRIERFNDLSYRQLRGYRPPPGSPLDPRRLP